MDASTSEENSVATAVYPARFESLSNLREFVGEAAEACCLNSKEVYAVQMAVDEAFTNIIEHAYGGESEESIECTCEVSETALKIVLRDCGKSFNPNAVPDPDLDAPLHERDAGGLGLFFMRQLMDEVHFEFAGEPGGEQDCNKVTMVKRRERKA